MPAGLRCREKWSLPVLDLFLLPIHVASGEDQTELPGLLSTAAPRRCDRTRAGDRLVALFQVCAGPALTPAGMEMLHSKLTDTFYRTRGTVTGALRAAAEQVNLTLLEQNRAQGTASEISLGMAVLRGDSLLVAICGPARAWLLARAEIQEIADSESGGRGLGISRKASPRFVQTALKGGELVLLSPTPLPAFSQTAAAERFTLENIRRRVMTQAGGDLQAALLQFQPGSGLLRRLRPRAAGSAAPSEPREQPQTPVESPASGPAPVEPAISPPRTAEPAFSAPAPAEAPIGAPPATESSFNAPSPAWPAPAAEPVRMEAAAEEPAPAGVYVTGERLQPPSPPTPRRPRRSGPVISPEMRKGLARVWFGASRWGQRVQQSAQKFLNQALPQSEDSSGGPSRNAMLFIAIAVPLVVVAIAATVYLFGPSGRTEQFESYVQQAAALAQQARDSKEREAQRIGWAQVVNLLDKAQEYGESAEASSLRSEASQALDKIDGITRLDFVPLVSSGFTSTAQFTRITANNSEIFLLDQSSGRVFRLYLTGQTYEVDNSFICGPGSYGLVTVDKLIDLALIPAGISDYTLLAMDAGGNLVYCGANKPPESQSLTPPDTQWGSISAIDFRQQVLYVLDQAKDQVWVYPRNQDEGVVGLVFSPPGLFFDEQVPDLAEVNDLVYYNQNLFLSTPAGRMITCTFRTFTVSGKTTCDENAPLQDTRSGNQAPAFAFPAGTQITQMRSTPPPEPAIYLLDAASRSVFTFSLRLNLVRQIQPRTNPDYPALRGKITAFTITPNRLVLLAYGNELYFAYLP